MPVDGFGEIAEKLRRSTVWLSAGRRGNGSGLIVRPDGIVVTNAHVAASADLRVGFWDGTTARAEMIRRDPALDLATLSVAAPGLPAASLADSDRVRVGAPVIAIGNPLGFVGALTTGVVRAVGRIQGLGPRTWIQADIRLAPGNSGGPLADAQGNVVGINTMVAGGVGLAVPSNAVSKLLARESARGVLGVVVHEVEVPVNRRPHFGLVILDVARNGAADTASLMQGDVLIGVNGRGLDSTEALERALDGSGEGVVRLRFLRGGRATVRTVAVRLAPAGVVAA